MFRKDLGIEPTYILFQLDIYDSSAVNLIFELLSGIDPICF